VQIRPVGRLLAASALSLLTVMTLAPPSGAAAAAPPPSGSKGEEPGNGPERNEVAAVDPPFVAARSALGENKAGTREG